MMRGGRALRTLVNELEKMGHEREKVCYVGDDLREDILPAFECGINLILLRRVIE